MKTNIKFFALAIFAVFSLFFVTATIAQTSTTGTVEGTVTDANGAVVPAAAITLSGPNLIRAMSTTSDADGNYRFSSVPPGRYVVEVAATTGLLLTSRKTSKSIYRAERTSTLRSQLPAARTSLTLLPQLRSTNPQT